MTKLASACVIRSGPCTLVSDLGRYGYQHLGVSPAGAADMHAHCWANHLLNNPVNANTLECCIGGLSLEFSHACSIAICGADMPCLLNQESVALWQTLHIKAGDVLSLAPARSGLRAYIAISKGWQFSSCLGSANSCLSQSLGVPIIHQQQALHYFPRQQSKLLACPSHYVPDYSASLTVNLLPAYQFAQFSAAAIEHVLSQAYLVENDSNRMGIRLWGEKPLPTPGDICSEGISLGSVQVPANGQPIILSCERQTIGGYPKLGSVARLDLFQLSQRRPKQSIRFVIGDWHHQRQRWLAFNRFFKLS